MSEEKIQVEGLVIADYSERFSHWNAVRRIVASRCRCHGIKQPS